MKLADVHLTLAEVRKERNLSQKDIAGMLNVDQACVSLYENGKRGIPLDILDDWLAMLDVDVKITPKGYEPVKAEVDAENDLMEFNQLKKRRNYLIAELRALQAEKLMGDPVFEVCNEYGELRFWPYSDGADPCVGLIETRYDHPQQKFLAVEYTKDEVNVYKFLGTEEVSGGEGDAEWLSVNRIYFTEEDILSLGGAQGQVDLELRRVTLLRRNRSIPDGVEIVTSEGFALRSLLEMQEHFLRYDKVLEEVVELELFVCMDDELEEVYQRLGDISLNNRLGNRSANPRFEYWTDEDLTAIGVPMWAAERNWIWIEEGALWREEISAPEEIPVMDGEELDRRSTQELRKEDGNRVVGLIGEEKKPTVFKSNPGSGDAICRVETSVEELSEQEFAEYEALREPDELHIDFDCEEG